MVRARVSVYTAILFVVLIDTPVVGIAGVGTVVSPTSPKPAMLKTQLA